MTLNPDSRFMDELRRAMEADLTGTAGAPSITDGLPSGTMDPHKDSDVENPEAPGASANPTDLGGESTKPEDSPYQGDKDSGNAGGPGDNGDPATEFFKERREAANGTGQADAAVAAAMAEGFQYAKCIKGKGANRAAIKNFRKEGAAVLYTVDASEMGDQASAAISAVKSMIGKANAQYKQAMQKGAPAGVIKYVPAGESNVGAIVFERAQTQQPASESAFSAIANFFKKSGGKGVPTDLDKLIEEALPIICGYDKVIHGPSGKRVCEKANILLEDRMQYDGGEGGAEDLFTISSFQDVYYSMLRADYANVDPQKTVIIVLPVEKENGFDKKLLIGNVGAVGFTAAHLSAYVEGSKKDKTGAAIGTTATEAESDFDSFLTNMNGASIITKVEGAAPTVAGEGAEAKEGSPGDTATTNPPQNGQPPQSIQAEREPGTGDTVTGNAGNPTGVNGTPVSKSGVPTGAAPSSYADTANAPNGNPPSPGVDATPDPSLDSFIGACKRTMIGGERGFIEIPNGMTMESYAMEIGMGELTARALESDMTAAERKALPDSAFGLPSQRKWPLNDEPHVRLAIKYFWRCPKEDQKELAKNILKAMRKFGITDVTVGPKNPFKDYYPKANVAGK